MWVAKIGGSLHAQPRLGAWLAACCTDTRRRWLLVPGGGPHADAVRREQQVSGYDDAEAHVRAIVAMSRYGEDLLALEPRLRRASSVADCERLAHAPGHAPVLWCPEAADARVFDVLPADWRVTSDSLAHALATRLGAEALVLLKSVPPSTPEVLSLAQEAYVDAWLPQLMAAVSLPVYWADLAPQRQFPHVSAGWCLTAHRISLGKSLKS